MTFRNTISVAVMLLFASLLVGSSVNAQSTFLRKTHVTFNGAVQIPGRVLPAGEYTFQLDVLPSNETSIVEIRDKDGIKVLATLLTIPDYRLKPTGDTVMLFRERAADEPQALRAWFYPGENFGHEFAYPRKQAAVLAAANQVNVPAVPDNTADASLNSAQVTSTTPAGSDEQVATTAAPAPTEAQTQPTTQTPTPSNDNNLVASNTPLPKTASPVYLIGLVGAVCFALGFILTFMGRRRTPGLR
jgi:hypothetical protein